MASLPPGIKLPITSTNDPVKSYVTKLDTTNFGHPPEVNDAGEIVGVSVDETLKERGNRYGKFQDHAAISQHLSRSCFDHAEAHRVYLSYVHREAINMICHKLGRIVNGDPNYDDSWRDIAGYATLVEKHINGEVV